MHLDMNSCREFSETSNGISVRGFLHSSATGNGDCLILTHGAGANCNTPLLVVLAEAFSTAGLIVLRCDLPFRQSRAQGPPPRGSAERDQEGLRAAVESMRRYVSGRIFLGGHSYGGRQTTMLAASDPGVVEALLLLSYPLHPPQRHSEMRTAHFPHLQIPALFVSGTRDGFGSIEEMTAALKFIPARTKLVSVQGAGHELMAKRNRGELQKLVVETFQAFTNATARS